MQIATIYNKHSKDESCKYYLNRDINIEKCVIEIGKPLKVVYKTNSFFTHEDVVKVEYPDEVTIKIETTKKIWILQS